MLIMISKIKIPKIIIIIIIIIIMIKLILILIQMQLIQILTLQTLTLLLKLKMINPSHLQHVTAKHKAVAKTPPLPHSPINRACLNYWAACHPILKNHPIKTRIIWKMTTSTWTKDRHLTRCTNCSRCTMVRQILL